MHDRDIVVRCDDSVPACAICPSRRARAPGAGVQFLRRARGFHPAGDALDARRPPAGAAFGAHLQNRPLCMARGPRRSCPSIGGDPDSPAACVALDEAAGTCAAIPSVPRPPSPTMPTLTTPPWPPWPMPGCALPLPSKDHHAHIAAVVRRARAPRRPGARFCRRHGWASVATACPGAAELLYVDGAGSGAWATHGPLCVWSGDRAAREPWRMACAVLHALGQPTRRCAASPISRRWTQVLDMLDARGTAPPTSSM